MDTSSSNMAFPSIRKLHFFGLVILGCAFLLISTREQLKKTMKRTSATSVRGSVTGTSSRNRSTILVFATMGAEDEESIIESKIHHLSGSLVGSMHSDKLLSLHVGLTGLDVPIPQSAMNASTPQNLSSTEYLSDYERTQGNTISEISRSGTLGSLAATLAWFRGRLRAPRQAQRDREERDRDVLLLIDEVTELRPGWDVLLADSWKHYFDRPDIAGISLLPPKLTSSPWAPIRKLHYLPRRSVNASSTESEDKDAFEPFLYGYLPQAKSVISPHPKRWTEFLAWARMLGLANFQVEHPSFFSAMFPINMTDYDAIYLDHTRKAGGSTMRSFLSEVADKHGLQHEVDEGYAYMGEAEMKARKNLTGRVLKVTTLRDPVERAISSYFFEGRWGQGQQHRTEKNAVSLDDWVNKTKRFCGNKKLHRFCWQCSSDCYSLWFGFDGKEGTNATYSRINAIRTLETFDVVINTNDLKNPAFTRSIQRLFDAVDIPFGSQVNKGVRKSTANITEEDLQQLAELNKRDAKIVDYMYGFAKDDPSLQEWYNMIEEENSWKKWTQLYSYWCKLNGLKMLSLDQSASHINFLDKPKTYDWNGRLTDG